MKTEELIKKRKSFINIEPKGIEWGYTAHYIIEDDGMYSWYIPSFDIFFSSMDEKEGDKIGEDATTAFFEYWLKKQGFRKFVNKVLSLGYKAKSFQELKNLLQRRDINANLEGVSDRLPKSFANSTANEYSGKLETAV